MKKLNEIILRKLILETIDEQVIVEGKKKKRLKEVEPVRSPEQPPESFNKAHAQTAAGIAQSTGQTDEVPDVDVAQILDQQKFASAVEAVNSGDDMKAIGGWSVLGGIADKIKEIIKQREGK